MKELGDKVAVVTGAGSGIGRALARRLAGEGMQVAAADIDADALDETVALLESDAPGGAVLGRLVDVSDAADVDALAGSVFSAWGRVEVLCNNAGVFVGGFLWDRPDADFRFVLGANLWGILHGIRAFVPRMIAQGTEGHIVNTSSVAGLFGSPYGGPYAISKVAAFAATETLAGDLAAIGSPLKVSVLCPGMIDTNIASSDRLRPESLVTELTEDQQFVSRYLSEAVASGMAPSEVAGMVVDAIREERFLVLTHRAYGPQLVARAEALAAGRLPDLPDFV